RICEVARTPATRIVLRSRHGALPILWAVTAASRRSTSMLASAKPLRRTTNCSGASRGGRVRLQGVWHRACPPCRTVAPVGTERRSEEHTSELQSREELVCRVLLGKKK